MDGRTASQAGLHFVVYQSMKFCTPNSMVGE